MSNPYGKQFYDENRETSVRSAAALAPWLMQTLQPASVIDVGCGLGAWAAALAAEGARDVVGLDGAHVDRARLRIPVEAFRAHDLCRPIEPLGRRFDLAVCLEVGEHLPPERAAGLVHDLVALSDVVLFSAAPPGQKGQHHVNEQWPEYWAHRFAALGYDASDAVRPRFWNDEQVAYWYAQNALIYGRRERLAADPVLREALWDGVSPLARIHPRAWLSARDPRQMDIRDALTGLPFALAEGLRRRWRAWTRAGGRS